MDERDLGEALEQIAAEVEVGPAPVGVLTASRRSWWVPVAAAAAVVVVSGAGAVLAGGSDDEPGSVAGSPTTSAGPTGAATDPAEVAPGGRLVGVGHWAIEVPAGWGTNRTTCGTPVRDTVVVDEGAICLALVPRPEGVETIRVEPLDEVVDLVGEQTRSSEVAGVEATVWETRCSRAHPDVRVCTAAVWLHGNADVKFTSEAATRARAEELLATIREVPRLVGLPGPNAFRAREASGHDRGPSRAGRAYLDAVEATGATVRVVDRDMPGVTPLTVLDVSPAPGTMLAPGDPVTVTVVAPQDTPAERVSVGLSWGGGGDDTSLTDAEFRAGRTIRVPVGTPVWAYYVDSAPVRRGDVTEEMTGDALARDHRNGPLWSYTAVRPGRSTYTLSVHGERIGSVTLVVTR